MSFYLKRTWQGILSALGYPDCSNYCQHLNIASSNFFIAKKTTVSACAQVCACVCGTRSEDRPFQELRGACLGAVVQSQHLSFSLCVAKLEDEQPMFNHRECKHSLGQKR